MNENSSNQMMFWYGERCGCANGSSNGNIHLVVCGHEGIIVIRDIDSVDAFIRDLGQLLGWTMPNHRHKSPIKLRRSKNGLSLEYLELTAECAKRVSDKLSTKEAKDLFGWLCESFDWVNA